MLRMLTAFHHFRDWAMTRVEGYTKKDGTVVQGYDTSRTKQAEDVSAGKSPALVEMEQKIAGAVSKHEAAERAFKEAQEKYDDYLLGSLEGGNDGSKMSEMNRSMIEPDKAKKAAAKEIQDLKQKLVMIPTTPEVRIARVKKTEENLLSEHRELVSVVEEYEKKRSQLTYRVFSLRDQVEAARKTAEAEFMGPALDGYRQEGESDQDILKRVGRSELIKVRDGIRKEKMGDLEDRLKEAKEEKDSFVRPNGRPNVNSTHSSRLAEIESKLKVAEIAKSPAFQEWFGNSKTVGPDGLPLVIYHGTKGATFTEFDPEAGHNDEAGVFGSTDRMIARSYSGGYTDDVTPVEVATAEEAIEAINNSNDEVHLETMHGNDEIGWFDTKSEALSEAEDYGQDEDELDELFNIYDGESGLKIEEVVGREDLLHAYNSNDDIKGAASGRKGLYPLFFRMESVEEFDAEGRNWSDILGDGINTTRSLVHAAKSNGSDGVIFRNVYDCGGDTSGCPEGDVYVVINPEDIKSVHNSGEFIKGSDNIMRSMIEVPGKTGPIKVETGELEGEEFNPVEPQDPRTVATADDIEVFDPEDLGKYEGEADDHLYHVTTTTSADSILKDGLQAGFKSNFDGHDEYSQGRVFFTERGGVDYWIERLSEQFDNETVVVLRIEVDELLGEIKTDPAGTRDAPATSYYIEPQEGDTESKTFTTMDGGALINPEFAPEKKAYKPLLKTRVDSYVKRDGTVVSGYDTSRTKRADDPKSLEKRTSIPNWKNIGWSKQFGGQDNTLFDMPKDDAQVPRSSKNRLKQYSDEQIAFMFEQAKMDKEEMGDEVSERLKTAFHVLKNEVASRDITNPEYTASNLNLTGLNRITEPFNHISRFDESGNREVLGLWYELRESANEYGQYRKDTDWHKSGSRYDTAYKKNRQISATLQEKKRGLISDAVSDYLTNELSEATRNARDGVLPSNAAEISMLNKDLKKINRAIYELSLNNYEAEEGGGEEAKSIARYHTAMNNSLGSELEIIKRRMMSSVREALDASPDLEQQFFGFDTGRRSESEAQAGMKIHLTEVAADLEAEAERLHDKLAPIEANTREAYFAFLNGDNLSIQKQKELEEEYMGWMEKKNEAFDLYHDALTEAEIARERAEQYGDLRERALTSEEKDRIAEIMTPTESEASVYLENGDSDSQSFDDLDYDAQAEVRERMAQDLIYEDFDRDAIEEQVRDWELSNHRRGLEDEVWSRVVKQLGVDHGGRYKDPTALEPYYSKLSEAEGEELYDMLQDMYDDSDHGFFTDYVDDIVTQMVDDWMDENYEDRIREMVDEWEDTYGSTDDLTRYARDNDMFPDAEQAILDNFGFGYEEIGSIIGAPDDAYVEVNYDGEDIKVVVHGDHIETMERTISKGFDGAIYVSHDIFRKEDDAPRGYATDILTRAVPNMIRAGVKSISLTAAGGSSRGQAARANTGDYTGYGVWPRNGFDVPIDRISSFDTRGKIEKRFPEAKMLTDIFATADGRDWWWKNGSSFQGTFDLSEGSRSIEILGRYALEIDNKRKAKER